MTDAYRERVATFGDGHGLVGIVTFPVGACALRLPHAILLNSGILHRVGPNRLYVMLARRLAVLGVTTLRFDMSGIGDSMRRPDVLSLRESVERDVANAIQYLTARQGGGCVVLMGVCSGAYDAMQVALGDARVVGAVMVDVPGPFQTWRHTVYHFGTRLFRLKSWRRPLSKAAYYGRALVHSFRAPPRDSGRVDRPRTSAPRQLMADQLARLLGRGVRLLIVFTAGMERTYNHRSQFRTTFPKAAAHLSLSFDYFEAADHDFGRCADREMLVETVVNWIQRAPFVSLPNGRVDAAERAR